MFYAAVFLVLSIVFISLYATKSCPAPAPAPSLRSIKLDMSEQYGTGWQTFTVPSLTQVVDITFDTATNTAANLYGVEMYARIYNTGSTDYYNLGATPSFYIDTVDVTPTAAILATQSTLSPPNWSGGVNTFTYYMQVSPQLSAATFTSLTVFRTVFQNPLPFDTEATIIWND